MPKFTGLTKVELEMLVEEIAKVVPALVATAPTFAELVRAHYDALKKQNFSGAELISLAVRSAATQMGFGG